MSASTVTLVARPNEWRTRAVSKYIGSVYVINCVCRSARPLDSWIHSNARGFFRYSPPADCGADCLDRSLRSAAFDAAYGRLTADIERVGFQQNERVSLLKVQRLRQAAESDCPDDITTSLIPTLNNVNRHQLISL